MRFLAFLYSLGYFTFFVTDVIFFYFNLFQVGL